MVVKAVMGAGAAAAAVAVEMDSGAARASRMLRHPSGSPARSVLSSGCYCYCCWFAAGMGSMQSSAPMFCVKREGKKL